jgi:small subunit ribosomal protein S16
MLMIRFRRIGKKNKPTYRLTVAEHTRPVNGSFVADLGFYNPHTKVAGLKAEAIVEWLNKGAQPSNSVAKLLTKEKIKHGSVVVAQKNKKSKSEKTEETPKAAAPAAANGATEESIADTANETVEEATETETPTEEQSAEVAATDSDEEQAG